MPGKTRDFIADLADKERVFQRTKLPDKRYAWQDLAALVTCLERARGPIDIKAPSLRKLYESETEFDVTGPVAKRVKKNLKYLDRVLSDSPPEMDIKWGFVDLYLLISSMVDSYVLTDRENEFCQFYISFELTRKSVEDEAELLETGDPWDKDLWAYIQAFKTGGGQRSSVESRHEMYIRRLLRDVPDLVPKDPTRDFSADEKVVIWRRDSGICQDCGKEVTIEEMHADHVVPNTKGGKTTVRNGQVLCPPCNLMKGAKQPS